MSSTRQMALWDERMIPGKGKCQLKHSKRSGNWAVVLIDKDGHSEAQMFEPLTGSHEDRQKAKADAEKKFNELTKPNFNQVTQ